MPELDQLLIDAAHDDTPTPAPALDDALIKARISTRRRHVLIGCGAAAVVIAASGGLLYAGTATSAAPGRHVTKLAAYDQVIGQDEGRPGHVLVIGPADEHTADCQKVPGDTVTVQHRGRYTSIGVSGVSVGDRISFPATLLLRHHHPQGPYYLFSCPNT